MKNTNALKTVLKMADDFVEEFYNLNELPLVPNFADFQEEIANNMPDVADSEYSALLNAATALMLKKALDKLASADGDALRLAFNALSSTHINTEKVDEMEDMINNQADNEMIEEADLTDDVNADIDEEDDEF